MPKVFEYGEYVVYFWSNEEGEPIHVHVAVRRPTEHATKLWLTKAGGCVIARNDGKIPLRDLRDICRIVILNHGYICEKWAERFGGETLRFYQ